MWAGAGPQFARQLRHILTEPRCDHLIRKSQHHRPSDSRRGFNTSFTSRGSTLTCHALPAATVRGTMCAKRQVRCAPPKVLVVENGPAVDKVLRISLHAAGVDVAETLAGR